LESAKLCKTADFVSSQEEDSTTIVVNETTNEEDNYEKFESLVMLAEDGSARIVVEGEDNSDDFVIGDNYVLGKDNDVHYVLQSDDGHFKLHSFEDENRETATAINVDDKLITGKDENEIFDNHETTTLCSNVVVGQDDGKLGDAFVLQKKDVDSVTGQDCSLQELKEKNRKNLVLEQRREQEGNILLNSVTGGQVIHQSELLDGSLVTGYVVVGEEQQVIDESGEEMVLMEEDQMMLKDGEQILLSGIEQQVYQKQDPITDSSTMAVAKKIKESFEVTETTNHYIQVDVVEQEQMEPSRTRNTGGWKEVGGTELEYDRKFVSKPKLEDNGRVSQGTVVCQWTKMPGDRVRVAHSKVIRPRVGLHEQEEGEGLQNSSAYNSTLLPANISAPLLYSSLGSVWRDVGCQVNPHKVNGLPTDREEEQRQVERIKQFLSCGGVLDRSCPGCGRVMSRQRNLVTHLQVIHGVEVKGPEGEEHLARYSKENLRVSCDICSKTISRKSIRRHVNLCHPDAVAVSRFTREKIKA